MDFDRLFWPTLGQSLVNVFRLFAGFIVWSFVLVVVALGFLAVVLIAS